MGTAFKGVQSTNYNAAIPKLEEQGYRGIRKTLIDYYVLLADLAASDSIDIGAPLPKGSMILGAELVVGALGGSCTLDMGWEASADAVEAQNKTALFNTFVASSAIAANMTASTGTPGTIGYILGAPVQVRVYEHAVSSGATGKQILAMVHYVET